MYIYTYDMVMNMLVWLGLTDGLNIYQMIRISFDLKVFLAHDFSNNFPSIASLSRVSNRLLPKLE